MSVREHSESIRSFDDLLDTLLLKIALCGDQGASVYNLQRYVEEFYDSGGIEYQAERTDGAQPGSDVARDHELATVDRLLLRRIWSWFVCHPDIRLSSVPDCEFVGTKDAKIDEREVEVTTSISRHFGNGKINKVARKRVNGEAGPNASASSSVLTGSLAEWDDFPRLFASEERMWKALTGHGVDHKKVPPHEFKLLSIIAAHGEQGILQPDLVRLSEQDKRSVPKRTDQLHQNGYIVKNKVFTRAMRTSCCVLKTFIRNTRRQDETGSNLEQTRDNNGDAVMLEEFLDTLMAKLKDATILTLPNLRQMLGFTQRKSRSKFLWRSLRRLEALGCLRVVYVENSDPTSEVRKWLKCAQFMKSPSAEDRLAYLTAKKSSKSIPKLKHDFDVDAKDDGQDSDALEADDDVIPQESVDSEKPPKIQPHWNPHTLFVNTISDLVKEAGRAGISSMQLRDLSLGSFWRRPFDTTIGRLSDAWEISQPPQLRHLALLRDTSVTDKGIHYIYRSYDSCRLAIDAGEAAKEILNVEKLNELGNLMPHSRLRADVDTWGFPPLAPEAFLHGTGTANIVEVARISEKSFHMKGSNNRPVGRPRKAIRKSDEEATLSSEAIFHSKHTKSGMEGSLHYNLTQYPPEINTPDPQLLEATQISYFEGPLGSIHGDQQTVRSLSKRKRVQLSSQDEGRALKRVRHDLVPTSKPTTVLTSCDTDGNRKQACVCIRQGTSHTSHKRGRPRKALIAVFYSAKLLDISWFVGSETGPSSVRRDTFRPAVIDDTQGHTSKQRYSAQTNDNTLLSDIAGLSLSTCLPRNGGGTSDQALTITADDVVYINNNFDENQLGRSVNPTTAKQSEHHLASGRSSYGLPTPKNVDVSTTHENTRNSNSNSENTLPRASSNTIPIQVSGDEADERESIKLPEKTTSTTIRKITSKKKGVLLGGGSLGHQRTSLLLDLMKQCGGALPGNSSINKPFTLAWNERYGGAIDHATIWRAIKAAVDSGKVRRVVFSFRAPDGFTADMNIITLAEIAPDAAVVKDLQAKMVKSYPDMFRPPQIYATSPHTSLPQVQDVSERSRVSQKSKLNYQLDEAKVSDGNVDIWKRRSTAKSSFSLYPHRRSFGEDCLANTRRTERGITRLLRLQTRIGTEQRMGSGALGPLGHDKNDLFSLLPRMDSSSLGVSRFPNNAHDFTIQRDQNHTRSLILPSSKVKRLPEKISLSGIYDHRYINVSHKGLRRSLLAEAGAKSREEAYSLFRVALRAPKQRYHSLSGTFATDFSYQSAVEGLMVASQRMKDIFNAYVTASTQDMRVKVHARQLRQYAQWVDQDYAEFDRYIHEIYLWEQKNQNVLTLGICTTQPQYINYTLPAKLFSTAGDTPSNLIFLKPLLNGYSVLSQHRESKSFTVLDPRLLRNDHVVNPTGREKRNGRNSRLNINSSPALRVEGGHSRLSHEKKQTSLFTDDGTTISMKAATSLQRSTNHVEAIGIEALKVLKELGLRSLKETVRFCKKYKLNLERLILCVMAVRVLAGGLSLSINWSLVSKAYHNSSAQIDANLKDGWSLLNIQNHSFLNYYEKELQVLLLDGYRGQHLPPLDFKDVEKYRWDNLVLWTLGRLSLADAVRIYLERKEAGSGSAVVSRLELESGATHKLCNADTDEKRDGEVRQYVPEEFSGPSTTQKRKEEILIAAYFHRLHDISPGLNSSDNAIDGRRSLAIAESWVRANVLTLEASYNPRAARSKLYSLGEQTIDDALANLLRKKRLVTGDDQSSSTRRNYAISSSSYTTLRKTFDESFLKDAHRFKQTLDEYFESPDVEDELDCYSSEAPASMPFVVEPTASPGVFLAITNLVAAGRIFIKPRLPPVSDQPDDVADVARLCKWGFTPGSYRTTTNDRKHLNFPLEIHRQASYVFGNPVRNGPEGRMQVPPVDPESDRIPLWVDIHGNVMHDWWKRVCCAIVGRVALRPGTTLEGILPFVGQVLDQWEIQLVLDYLLRLKAVRLASAAIRKKGSEAYHVNEWWWMIHDQME